MSKRAELARTLTCFDATMIVMGTIIGVGIFFTPRDAARATGSTGLSLLAWCIGGVIAVVGGSTYAALGRLHPQTGGPYVYLREGFGRLVAFLYGWMALSAIVSGAIAVIGIVFAEHVAYFLPMSPLAKQVVAAGTILGLSAINVVGVRAGASVQNLVMVLKLGALLFLIGAGLWKGTHPITFDVDHAIAPGSTLGGLAAAMVAVMFSFGGWQNAANVAGEMKDPERELPKAILLGVAGVLVVYVLASYAFVSLLPLPDLVRSATPAVDALQVAIGDRAGQVVAAAILLSAFGIVNGLLLSTPRIYFAMAQDGLLFRAFGSVHPRFRTPVVAILVQACLSGALCFWGSVSQLLAYVVFADGLFFALNGYALFAIARKHPGMRPGYGYPWTALLFSALMTVVTIGITIQTWESARVGILLMLAGVAVYAVFLRGRRVSDPA